MEKQKHYQLELFSGTQNTANSKSTGSANALLSYIKTYERTILIIIALAATGIISFTLGVEKGKKVSGLKKRPKLDIAVRQNLKESTPARIQKKARIAPAQNNLRKEESAKERKKNIFEGFTIQLASYKTRKFANLEADRLKKKGFTPLVLAKGDYIVLCVGKFHSKERARAQLSKFKKRYDGCYVRRL